VPRVYPAAMLKVIAIVLGLLALGLVVPMLLANG
jgi:hypothetical protein